jgi:succinoglycan biosynthesis transport protein ExoP
METTERHDLRVTDLRGFLDSLKRNALLIAAVAIGVAAAAYVISTLQLEQYKASTTLLFSPGVGDTDGDPGRSIDTLVQLAGSNRVLTPVAKAQRDGADALRQAIRVTGDANADILTITATARVPERAKTLANSVANSLIAYQNEKRERLIRANIQVLRRQLDLLERRGVPASDAVVQDLRAQLTAANAELLVDDPDLSIITPAEVPSAAFTPQPKRNAAIGLIVGLLLGLVLASLRERLDRRIRSVDEIETLYGAPTLGLVPFAERGDRSQQLADFIGASPLADAYRTIRTNLSLVRLAGDHSVIVVSSAAPQEGKSAVTANLALALAMADRKVLAISADVHSPALHEYFARYFRERLARAEIPGPMRNGVTPLLSSNPGIVEVLAGDVPFEHAVRRVGTGGGLSGAGRLDMLASDRTFFDPAVLYQSDAMKQFLKRVRDAYDVVLIDAPPFIATADAALLAKNADVVLLVARVNHLTRNQARRALRMMHATDVTPAGIVITGEFETDIAYGTGYYTARPGDRPAAVQQA